MRGTRRLAIGAALTGLVLALAAPPSGAASAPAAAGAAAAADAPRDQVFVGGVARSGVLLYGASGDWVVSPEGRVVYHRDGDDRYIDGAYRLCGDMLVTATTSEVPTPQKVSWRDLATGRTGTMTLARDANLLGPAPGGVVYAVHDGYADESVVWLQRTDGSRKRLGAVPDFVDGSQAVCDASGVAVVAKPSASPRAGEKLRVAYASFSGTVTVLASPTYSTSRPVFLHSVAGRTVLWSVGEQFSTSTTLYRSVAGGTTTTVTTVPTGSALVGAGGSATVTVYTVENATTSTSTQTGSTSYPGTLGVSPAGSDSRWWVVDGRLVAAGEDGVWTADGSGGTRRWAPPHVASVSRVSAPDRYATAAGLWWPDGLRTVYVASGEDYPDALSGVPAAVHDDAALVLTPRDRLAAPVRGLLTRQKPDEVVVLGGRSAVSSTVETALRAYAPTVRRIQGADRYATSIAISRDRVADAAGGTVVLVSGTGFADALGAGPAAAHWGGPVLLTDPRRLRADTARELERIRPDRVVVVGGTSAVSAAVEAAVRAHAPTVTRISGSDRYGTAARLSAAAFPVGTPRAAVTSGEDFPDGLAAGAFVGLQDGPLLLTARTRLPAGTAAEVRRLRLGEIDLVGGEKAVAEPVQFALMRIWWW